MLSLDWTARRWLQELQDLRARQIPNPTLSKKTPPIPCFLSDCLALSPRAARPPSWTHTKPHSVKEDTRLFPAFSLLLSSNQWWISQHIACFFFEWPHLCRLRSCLQVKSTKPHIVKEDATCSLLSLSFSQAISGEYHNITTHRLFFFRMTTSLQTPLLSPTKDHSLLRPHLQNEMAHVGRWRLARLILMLNAFAKVTMSSDLTFMNIQSEIDFVCLRDVRSEICSAGLIGNNHDSNFPKHHVMPKLILATLFIISGTLSNCHPFPPRPTKKQGKPLTPKHNTHKSKSYYNMLTAIRKMVTVNIYIYMCVIYIYISWRVGSLSSFWGGARTLSSGNGQKIVLGIVRFVWNSWFPRFPGLDLVEPDAHF